MLVLMRKCGEEILIGENISIKITEISGDKVKIGIEAPRDVKVYRKEICQTMESNKAAAAPVNLGELKRLLEKAR